MTRRVVLDGLMGDELPVDVVERKEDGQETAIIRHDVLEEYICDKDRFTVTYKLVYCNPAYRAVVECHMTDRNTQREVIKVGESCDNTLDSPIAKNYMVTMAYQRAYNRAAIVILGLERDGQGKLYSDLEVKRKDFISHKNYVPEDTTVQDLGPADDFDVPFEMPGETQVAKAEPEKVEQPKEVKPEAEKPKAEAKAEVKEAPKPETKVEAKAEVKAETAAKPEPVKARQSGDYVMTDDTVIVLKCVDKGKTFGEAKTKGSFQKYVDALKKAGEIKFATEEEQKQYDFLRNYENAS